MILVETLPLGSLSTNCYLVRREGAHDCLLIDPGADGRQIAQQLGRENLHLVAIALTHGHFDHGRCEGFAAGDRLFCLASQGGSDLAGVSDCRASGADGFL